MLENLYFDVLRWITVGLEPLLWYYCGEIIVIVSKYGSFSGAKSKVILLGELLILRGNIEIKKSY